MEPATTVLGGMVIAIISGVIGKSIGTNDNVKNKFCNERQRACQNLLVEKIESLHRDIKSLTDIVNGKLLGL